MVVLGGRALSYERGTPVTVLDTLQVVFNLAGYLSTCVEHFPQCVEHFPTCVEHLPNGAGHTPGGVQPRGGGGQLTIHPGASQEDDPRRRIPSTLSPAPHTLNPQPSTLQP